MTSHKKTKKVNDKNPHRAVTKNENDDNDNNNNSSEKDEYNESN